MNDPFSIVLSRKTAQKYFRDEDPLGKTLKLDNRYDCEVTGVFEEIPANTHFHFDIFSIVHQYVYKEDLNIYFSK